MAVTQLVDKVNIAVEKNETTTFILLDLSEAFDTIDQKILLHKLEYNVYRGTVLQWFKNYLTIRTQYINYNKLLIRPNVYCILFSTWINMGSVLYILWSRVTQWQNSQPDIEKPGANSPTGPDLKTVCVC